MSCWLKSMDEKLCSKCKTSKLKTCFSKQTSKADGLQTHCKTCKREYKKAWDLANAEYVRSSNSDWHAKNKCRTKATNAVWYKNNKEKALHKCRQWRAKNRDHINKKAQQRHKNNIEVKVKARLRTRLHGAIRNNYKSGSAVVDLGCSVEFFKKYLESQFVEGMTWDNWSRTGWHIDHIIPLCRFDLTKRDELLIACHYTNHQPLWAKDNMSKNK